MRLMVETQVRDSVITDIHVAPDEIDIGILTADGRNEMLVYLDFFSEGKTALEVIGHIMDSVSNALDRPVDKQEGLILLKAMTKTVHQWCD